MDLATLPLAQDAGRYRAHVRRTVQLAAPIALALLAEIGMGLISTVMLGSVSDRALAVGAFGNNVFFTVLLVLQGILSGVGVLAANRLGAGQSGHVPGLYWSGVLLAVLLAIPMFAVLGLPASAWQALGQPASLAADLADYLHILRWAVPAGLVGVGMMRQFLPAVGLERVLMWVLPAGLVLHAVLNLILVRGVFGFAGYGLAGSAVCVVITLSAIAVTLVAVLHRPRHGNFVRLSRPDAAVVGQLLGLGLPIGGTVLVEAGLFLCTGILAGMLGPGVLAAHMIALSTASVTFMIPLAISQAANVLVANAQGAGNLGAARRAGFASIALALAFMSLSAMLLSLAPQWFVALYLKPQSVEAAATASLAASLLRVASVFQLFDGTQVAAAGALRGLQDVKAPMVIATLGYWGIGFWAGWFLAFRAGLGAVGLWWGLCAGLAVVAVALTWRFAERSKPSFL